MEIYLYFQDQSNRIRELRFEGKTGTFACGAGSGYASTRWMYTQSAERDIQEFEYLGSANKWIISKPLELRFTQDRQQTFDLGANIKQQQVHYPQSLSRGSTARLASDIAPTSDTFESISIMAAKC